MSFSISRRLIAYHRLKCLFGTIALFVSLLLPSAAPEPAHAFKPNDDGHKKITRQALGTISARLSDGTPITFGNSAIEQVVGANVDTDLSATFFTSEAHFDNELLEESSDRLATQRVRVINALKHNPPNGPIAREYLGRMLHTLQDFYAHSNWVEVRQAGVTLLEPVNAEGQLVKLPNPSPDTRFCPDSASQLDTTIHELTTGYFQPNTPDGKCRHGEVFPLYLSGLSKDEPDPDDAPYQARYSAAHVAATEASRRLVRGIIDDPALSIDSVTRDAAIQALMNYFGSLTVVIDISSSMADEINGVKRSVRKLVGDSIIAGYEPDEYILVTFNDPANEGSTLITTQAADFIQALDAITVTGGGDCPEFAQTGLLNALEASRPGSRIYLFSDASAKDADLATSVNQLATEKRARISALLTGSCSPIDPSYFRVTAATGGQLVQLTAADLGNLDALLRTGARDDFAALMVADGTFNASPQNFTLPIDSTIGELMISVYADQKSTLSLRRPSGVVVAPGDSDATITTLSQGWLVNIRAPQAGQWQLTVSGSGRFSVSAGAQSSLQFATFNFVRLNNDVHGGWFPITGLPTERISTGEARLVGTTEIPSFTMVAQNGVVLGPLTLAMVDSVVSGEYRGAMTLPDEPFRIMASGQDSAGHVYNRMYPTLFRLQATELEIDALSGLGSTLPGATNTMRFTIRNRGIADTFKLVVHSNFGQVALVGPDILSLAANASTTVDVDYMVPLGSVEGANLSISLDVTSTTLADRYNGATQRFLLPVQERIHLPAIQVMTSTLNSFSDTFQIPASGWYEGRDANTQFSYQAGMYEILLRTDDRWAGITAPVRPDKDYEAEVDILRRYGDDGIYGMVFNFSSWNRHLIFAIDPGKRSFAVWRRDGSVSTSIPWTFDTNIRPDGQVNHLRIMQRQPGIAVYNLEVNGAVIAIFRSTAASTTRVGLYAENPPGGSSTATIRFDNFRLSKLAPLQQSVQNQVDSPIFSGTR